MKKVLPIGISSYETLKNKDYYVVDKTKLIEKIFKSKSSSNFDYKTKEIWENLKYVYDGRIF